MDPVLRRRAGHWLLVAAVVVGAAGGASAATAPQAAASAAVPAVELVRQRLQLSAVLQGEFEQTKTIAGFRNPLVSHGDFLVARGQGVVWHTTRPFESTLVVTKTRLFTRTPDGTTANVLDAQAEPGMRQVSELVFALLAADLGALAERFAIEGEAVGAQGWKLVLVPRDPQLAKFIARATLEGDRNVASVRLEEARGDATQIRFARQVPSAALTPADAARLQ